MQLAAAQPLAAVFMSACGRPALPRPAQVVKAADVIFVAVKPQYVGLVLREVRGAHLGCSLQQASVALFGWSCSLHVLAVRGPGAARGAAENRGACAAEGLLPCSRAAAPHAVGAAGWACLDLLLPARCHCMQVRPHLEDRHTVVSIAAGITLQSLKVGGRGLGSARRGLSGLGCCRGAVEAAGIALQPHKARSWVGLKGCRAAGLQRCRELQAAWAAEVQGTVAMAWGASPMQQLLHGGAGRQPSCRSAPRFPAAASPQDAAGEGARLVRVMPNTPCLVGETAAAM